jgi:hypothetical protein
MKPAISGIVSSVIGSYLQRRPDDSAAERTGHAIKSARRMLSRLRSVVGSIRDSGTAKLGQVGLLGLTPAANSWRRQPSRGLPSPSPAAWRLQSFTVNYSRAVIFWTTDAVICALRYNESV